MHLSSMDTAPRNGPSAGKRSRYIPPDVSHEIPLTELLQRIGRPALERKQLALLQRGERDVTIYYSGDLCLLEGAAVSIVGTREVSEAGRARATRLGRELAEAGVLVVSGLAKGVDHAAHSGAIQGGGHTAGVIGTSLMKAYPAENSRLQEEIYRNHLLLTPFSSSDQVFRGNFPARNRVMAAVTDATVIVEASDTSGTLHQAAECQRLGRWLFILRSVAEDPRLSWPRGFIGKDRVVVLSSTSEILGRISQ